MFFPFFIPIPIPFSTSRRTCVYPQYYQYQPLRTTVMVGSLPEDFLRLPSSPPTTQEEQDRAAAIHLQNQIIAEARQPIVRRFEITLVNAVLNKNYGLSRMDPYVRLRIGHHVYETHTVPNGAKTPYWNKTFQIYNLPQGVNTMHIEIFDERTLTEDELIAWAHITIPEIVTAKGEAVDDWYKLSGKLGDEMEGVIHVVMSYSTGPASVAPSVMMLPGYASGYSQVPIYTLPAPNYALPATYPMGVASPPMQRPPPDIKESDIKQLSEMFPSIEETAIKSVLEASSGNKETAINSLLQMQQ